jgi:hypothetical protein
MTQYDAGPGEWSDRPWDDPDHKPKPQAKRRRVTLPPWALLTILVGIVILLCVGLVFAVNAIRGGRDPATPTPEFTATAAVTPTVTRPRPTATAVITQTPTPTVVLPIDDTPQPEAPTTIAPGATVVVQGTLGAGLNLREQPSTYSKVVANAKEGASLVVLDGPREADGYVWWKLQTAAGKEGWGAANWLVLQADQ